MGRWACTEAEDNRVSGSWSPQILLDTMGAENRVRAQDRVLAQGRREKDRKESTLAGSLEEESPVLLARASRLGLASSHGWKCREASWWEVRCCSLGESLSHGSSMACLDDQRQSMALEL